MARVISLGIAVVMVGVIIGFGLIPPVRTLWLGGVYGPNGSSTRVVAKAQLEPASAARGETVYLSKCIGCHTPEAGIGPEHKSAEIKAKYPRDDQLADLLRSGRHPMPQFTEAVLGDQALADLTAYLRSKP